MQFKKEYSSPEQLEAQRILRNVHHVHKRSSEVLDSCTILQKRMDQIKNDIETTNFQCERFLDYKNIKLTDDEYKQLQRKRQEEIDLKRKQIQSAGDNFGPIRQCPEPLNLFQLPQISGSRQQTTQQTSEQRKYIQRKRNTAQVIPCFTQENEDEIQSIEAPHNGKIIIYKGAVKGTFVKIDMDKVKRLQDQYIKSRLPHNRRRTINNFRTSN